MNNYILTLPDGDVKNFSGLGGAIMCDDAVVRQISRRIFQMVLNDGNNWGLPSRNAATMTNQIIDAYLNGKLKKYRKHPTKCGSHIASYHNKALLKAHDHLVEHVEDPDEKKKTGSTCPIIATILDNTLHITSVGDCKVFVINASLSTITEPTAKNRGGLDAKDPGGRIGPNYDTDHKPDFRNYLYTTILLEPGDYVIVCSDGVHDNLNPKYLGLHPKDLALPEETWNETHLDEITNFMSKKLLQILGEFKEKNKIDSLIHSQISEAICNYIEVLTKPRKQWMIDNPKKKELPICPEMPGKLDHAGHIVYQHPFISGSEPCSSSI